MIDPLCIKHALTFPNGGYTLKVFFLALAIFFNSNSLAIGLSKLTVTSAVGERFYGLMTITGADGIPANEIFVSLAPRSAYRTLGVEWEYFHTQLLFDVLVNEQEQYTIRIVSTDVAFEPYLDFVLLLRSPAGSVLKQLTVLLDMPAQVKPSVANTAKTIKTPLPQNRVHRTAVIPTETTHKPKVSFTPTSGAANKPLVDSTRSSLAKSEQQNNSNNWSHRSRSGDSLWAIARRVQAKAGGNIKPIVDALYKNNPTAFINNDANRLKINAKLRVSAAQINAVIQTRTSITDPPFPATTLSESLLTNEPSVNNDIDMLSLVTADNSGLPMPAETKELSDRSSELAESFDKGLAESKVRKLSVENRINKLYDQYSTLAEKTEQLRTLEQTLNQSLTEAPLVGLAKLEPLALSYPVVNDDSPPSVVNTKPSDSISRKPLMWVLSTAVTLLILLVVLLRFWQNRRRAAAIENWELGSYATTTNEVLGSGVNDRAFTDPAASLEAAVDLEHTDDLEHTNDLETTASTSDTNSSLEGDDTKEVSARAEGAVELQAAVYIAYERYDEAEDLIEQALEFEPDDESLQLQLLEVYAAKRKLKHFNLLANQLGDLNNDKITLKINYLKSKL